MIRYLILILAVALPFTDIATADDANVHRFCPGDDIPYTFTVFEDVLLINRINYRVFCQAAEGPNFECMDKGPASETVSVYTVQSRIEDDGSLIFQAGEDSDPIIAPRCEK